MFLMHKPTGVLVEVLSLPDMFDPCQPEVRGRKHAGEELQDPEQFVKSELVFPSGETLPVCWVNAHYRDVQPAHKVAVFSGLPL
jgi:hypothetical protein